MMEIQRRSLLAFVGSGILIPTAGCQGDFPASRVMDFMDVTVSEAEEGWKVETTVHTSDNTGRYFAFSIEEVSTAEEKE